MPPAPSSALALLCWALAGWKKTVFSGGVWILGLVLVVGLAAEVPAQPEDRSADTAQAAEPLRLEELMRRMADTSGVVSAFRQTKELALLTLPLTSEGMLRFIPPACMAWEITSPGTSTLVIEGESLHFRDGTSADQIDLSQDRVARGFVQSFMVLFNGDLDAMKQQYEIEFESDRQGWQLRLVPRNARAREFIASIELRGQDGPLRQMVLLEADGDRTTTVFERTQVDYRFSREETRELFGSDTVCGRG